MLLAATLLAACNTPQKDALNTGDSSLKDDYIPQHSIDTTYKIFKGLFTLSSDVSELVDCDRQTRYWIADSTGKLSATYKKIRTVLPYENESIYAELQGYLSGKADTGNASAYENVLVVTKINKTQVKSFRTECYPFEFIATGNEPFWSIDIVPAEQRIVLKEIGKDSASIFPYQPANIGGGIYRFESKTSQKERIAIIIREEKCADGMSDRQYNYSAEVIINGRMLKGCAIKKGEQFDGLP